MDGDQQPVIRPGSQLHAAVLQVEGEVEHDDLTVALEDGGGVPGDHPRVLQQNFGLVDDGEVAVGAAEKEKALQ